MWSYQKGWVGSIVREDDTARTFVNCSQLKRAWTYSRLLLLLLLLVSIARGQATLTKEISGARDNANFDFNYLVYPKKR